MFERFTDQARRVVVLAQEEARLLGHGYIGTEHILLGLLSEEEGIAAQALGALEITADAAREQLTEIVGEGTGQPGGHIPFTSRTKKVLELSLREAQRLGDSSIGTEHILLGLAREGEGIGAQVLHRLGASKDRVLAQVLMTRKQVAGEQFRRVSAMGMPQVERTRPVNVREVVSRLDEISARLSAIEDLLAGMQQPGKPATRKAPAGQRKPGGARRTPPARGTEPAGPAEPPGLAEPPRLAETPGREEPPVAQA